MFEKLVLWGHVKGVWCCRCGYWDICVCVHPVEYGGDFSEAFAMPENTELGWWARVVARFRPRRRALFNVGFPGRP